ncbi:MAG: hypothetical protein F4Y27_11490 [Acidimicrobiaceae bacterium]|nr:YbaY family lipoprotein [Acidimicrobiaceae bacterium]MXW61392.1 hypothetical protein [Acidimicrobiaceae bacterium]MXW75910.1 hypothetical protein [Acidimicrobiaceae bacterium]MYA75285.1 hypothetical protein [Acidimicrobiaceae bacterium]MYC41141.1 hypothetical protein [Acidimicrobiaceae bacterium]
MGTKKRTNQNRVVAVVGITFALLLGSACQSISGSGDSVQGTVNYLENLELTDDAVLRVRLYDTSYADASAELIAEQIITDPGQVPIKFNVEYDPDDIDPRATYSISASIIETGDRLAFTNDTAYDVVTRGNPTRVNMLLVMATPPPDPTGQWNESNWRTWVEAEVPVLGAEVVEYHPEVIVFVEHLQSTMEGCVRRGPADVGFEVRGSDIFVSVTLQQPPPTPWAIPCDDDVVTVEADVRFGDSLVSGETYRVIANGVETVTFTAP